MTEIPSPGLGTSGNEDPEQCAKTVRTALELGYRHVDTAQMYGNEESVGAGIARADVPREDVFLATKVLPDNLAHDDVLETTDESLDRLGTDYVDLLYVHWPMKAYEAEDTLPAFDKIAEAGKARNIAVSNFTPELLDEACEILDTEILANQVEMHPLFQQDDLRTYARKHDITLIAYSPIMQGEAGDVPELRDIAEKHDATRRKSVSRGSNRSRTSSRFRNQRAKNTSTRTSRFPTWTPKTLEKSNPSTAKIVSLTRTTPRGTDETSPDYYGLHCADHDPLPSLALHSTAKSLAERSAGIS
ncbi:aldo/keto reductase [Halobacterium noricense]|uniref:Aldo/keto reductase n=1 Tax=Haladaptatus pallidirubidus TaxID=1008152 RepID=A0AAV3UFD2_9EURY